MELIEKNEAGQTIAKLRATIWKTTYQQLRQKFYRATQRDIITGIKALVRGSSTHHSIYGLSFNIFDIDPSYTMGDMERLRQEILLKLRNEGVAELNKSLPMPMAPQRIAVISAQGAAGYGDFMNQLTNNSEGFVFYTCLFNCVMQGDRTSESIRDALELIESTADLWDCIAIVRGGGATTDLNGFDEYHLAKAVASCGIPIVVGIGHERDRNVLDEIAHTSLKTPTAVAGFFIDKMREAHDVVLSMADRIRIYSQEMMIGEERRLSGILSLLPQLAIHKVTSEETRLKDLSGKIPLLSQSRLEKEKIKIESHKTLIKNFASSRFDKEKLKISGIISLLTNLTGSGIERSRQNLNSLESLIKVLDPKNTIKRGYSITKLNGKSIKSISEIKEGDLLTTILIDGELHSRIEKK